jgi:hypothetical protein
MLVNLIQYYQIYVSFHVFSNGPVLNRPPVWIKSAPRKNYTEIGPPIGLNRPPVLFYTKYTEIGPPFGLNRPPSVFIISLSALSYLIFGV